MAGKMAGSTFGVAESSTQDDSSETAAGKIAKVESSRKRDEDLNSGMELLELNFLLTIIENTKGDDKDDVAMRKLTFDELLRRNEQNQIDSKALAEYAVNQGDLYGKGIQCEAMKELTKRTVQHTKKSS